MFIKLGQVASTRSDLLPAPVIAELTQLQTAVPPADPDAIREVVEEELGRPVEEVFAPSTGRRSRRRRSARCTARRSSRARASW